MKKILKKNWLEILIFTFLIFLILATYKDYSISWDEKVFLDVGKFYLVKIFNFLHIQTNLSSGTFIPTPYHIKGHGVFYDVLLVLSSLFFKEFNFERYHLIKALWSLPIFFLVYKITKSTLEDIENQTIENAGGAPRGTHLASISIVLLLLSPRFFGDIFSNSVDIASTLFFAACLYYFLYYWKSKKTFLDSVLYGAIFGLTINQRFILIYVLILNFFFLLAAQRKNLKTFFKNQFIIGLSTIFFLHLTHPYLLSHPLTGLYELATSAQKYPWTASVLFEGSFFQAGINPLPWYYLPKSILITTPISTVLLFGTGLIYLWYLVFRTGIKTNNRIIRWRALYLLSLFFIPLLAVIILKPTLYDSWRHFMFLTVPIIIIALYGLKLILNHKSFILKSTLLFLVLFDLAFVAYEMKTLYPYQYIYYNQLVGGLPGAYGKYETDYWGLGYKEATKWFIKNVNDGRSIYKIYTEGDPLSSSYYFNPNMRLTTNINEADYIFTFTRWDLHLKNPGKTIYKVERQYVPLIFIKKRI